MRKKISVKDLKLGMYIHEMCGSWMDHPFMRSRFLLELEKDLKSLRASAVREVWIDVEKGIDVPKEVVYSSEADEAKRVGNALSGAAEQKTRSATRTASEEMAYATKIKEKSRAAMMEMFEDVRMGNAVRLEEASSLVDEINGSLERNSDALLSVLRLKTADDYTYMHSVAVCALMVSLGRALGLPDDLLKEAGMAGLLHDVGKAFIPAEVLNKPGRLTDAEFDIMKRHPVSGWEALVKVYPADSMAVDVCRHHHERTDGKGYPDGLSGAAISLYAKMGAVCDVYDAITSNRCYKPGWPPAESVRKMAEWQPGHFDETVFKAFVKTVGIYPVGTVLKMKSGRLALVSGQRAQSLLQPSLIAFFSWRASERIPPESFALKDPKDIMGIEDPAAWGFDQEWLLSLV